MDVVHSEKPNVPKKELQKKLAEIFKISDESSITLFGFKTRFGGLKSTGFGFIYNNTMLARKTEPIYRLLRNKLLEVKIKQEPPYEPDWPNLPKHNIESNSNEDYSKGNNSKKGCK